jgi:hypothetical protein
LSLEYKAEVARTGERNVASQFTGKQVRNTTVTQSGGIGIEETIARKKTARNKGERKSGVIGGKEVKMLNLMHRREGKWLMPGKQKGQKVGR